MRLGIDLGGTKIEGAILDHDNQVVCRLRRPTPATDYQQILTALATLVDDLERDAGAQCTVGVGIPGTISPASGRVKNANTTVLNGTDIARDLSALLGREVRFANDANCLALSEAIDGAAAGYPVVFGVILGTGTGGGVVVERRVLTGRNAIAGEWGHNPLPWPNEDELVGPRCYCGKRGCLETFLSGAGLQLAYRAVGGEQQPTARQIAARAEQGECSAQAALEIYARRLARGLASIINVLDPDIIVCGGGLSQIAFLYHRVPEIMAEYVFSDHLSTELRPAAYGDSSGVRGAAWLWPAPD